MTYTVKEIFYTLQGEGTHTGRPAVFLRLSGCNLWSGREADRAAAACNFCDTDFVGGTKYADAEALAAAVRQVNDTCGFVVITGGEPLLQLDDALCNALHRNGYEIALESNGTLPCRVPVDHLCISPKGRTKLLQTSGDELKLVYPQDGIDPAAFLGLNFKRFYLQPLATAARDHTKAVIDYCLQHPQWRLSLQTHKILGID